MFVDILKALFGGSGGRNVITETVGAFVPNADSQAQRQHDRGVASLDQFGKEFQSTPRQHWFDSLIDGLNRLPRPAMALGVISLFVSAMVSPGWFAERMVGIALVPDPLWWLLGAIVAFYFGGRHQAKMQKFDIEKQVADVETVIAGRKMIQDFENPEKPLELNVSADEVMSDLEKTPTDRNPVIEDWAKSGKG